MGSIRRVLSLFLLISGILFLSSCTTEFERVRTSNNPQQILKKAHEYYDAGKYVNAQTLYELAIQYYRGKAEAEDLFYKYAYTFYYTGEYISAAHYFKSFATTFYNSANKEDAAFMAAYSHYKLSPIYKLDQTSSRKAIDEFQEFVNNFPLSVKVDQCNNLIDELRGKLETKAFAQGKLYYNIGQYQAAQVSFQNMLKDFPGSDKEEEIKYLLVKSSYVLAENSVIDKRKERYEETKKLAVKYIPKFMNESFKKEVQDILEQTNKKLNLGA